MSFELAASPDLSNDVIVDFADHRPPHAQLLNDARYQVHQSTEGNDPEGQGHGSFDFSRKELDSLPAELADIISQHAERLALGSNLLTGLSYLGPRMVEFTHLRYLVMGRNRLQEFPRAILDCVSLQTLDIVENEIVELPEDFARLKNLKKFAMNRNLVKRIPTCIASMTLLKWIDAARNPIEFPPKKEWRVNPRYSDESTLKGIDGDRRMEETHKLKRALSQHAKSGRSPESEQSESATDTPKPARKRTGGGRFPIKPSMGGVIDVDAANNGLSTSPATRPLLKSSKTTHVPQTPKTSTQRPGVQPLTSSDRHRSNSESQMTTNRRQKRMGIHVSRGSSANSSADISLDGVELNADQSKHARGTSTSSLVHQLTHEYVDYSGPDSPGPMSMSRSASFYGGQSRLSSLPESRRKSQYKDPFVDLADAVVYSMGQMEAPLKKLMKATRSAGRKTDLERAYGPAVSSRTELDTVLSNLETLEEDAGDKRESILSVLDRCEMTATAHQKLFSLMGSHIEAAMVNMEPREVRTMMHTTFATFAEVTNIVEEICNSATKDDGDDVDDHLEVQNPKQATRASEQLESLPTSPVSRPATSLRVKDRSRVAHHHHQSSNMNKPLPSPRSTRSTSTTNSNSRNTSYSMSSNAAPDIRRPPTPPSSIPRSNSVLSTASTDMGDRSINVGEDTDEDKSFKQIFKSLDTACNASLSGLPICSKIFVSLGKKSHEPVYDQLLQSCYFAQNTCGELKDRLKSFRVNDTQERERTEFWQICTRFTKAWYEFVRTMRSNASIVPSQIKTLLRPIQAAVKQASTLIDKSPWQKLAVHGPNSAGPSPAVNGSLPFSMSNPDPPPIPPPVRDLPARPTNHNSPYNNGLGLHTPYGSSTSLHRSDTVGSNDGWYPTVRAAPTSHPHPVNNVASGNLSRSQSRAAAPPPLRSVSNTAPTSNPSYHHNPQPINGNYGTYYADPTPTSAAYPDPYYPNSDHRWTPSETSGNGYRSGHSSGYPTPLPATPMSAALGPAAQATTNGDGEGTVRRINGINQAHEKQNSWENVVTGYPYNNGSNGYYGNQPGWYANGSSGSTTSLASIPASLRSGYGGPGGAELNDRAQRPDVLPRSASAAGNYPGYYPSAIPQRMGSRNVSRSASQRR